MEKMRKPPSNVCSSITNRGTAHLSGIAARLRSECETYHSRRALALALRVIDAIERDRRWSDLIIDAVIELASDDRATETVLQRVLQRRWRQPRRQPATWTDADIGDVGGMCGDSHLTIIADSDDRDME